MVDADETALGALYDHWGRPVYSLVLYLIGDPDEAEDVVEETFWQAWRQAPAYEPSKGAVSTWLLTIGRRKALDRLRAKKRQREDPAGLDRTFTDLTWGEPDPSRDMEDEELRQHVRAELSELPDEEREVLELGYLRGLSQSEIAESTGQPLGGVKARMRLAMQKLRDPPSTDGEATE